MSKHHPLLLAFALALTSASCSDPVPDREVERLGPEKDGVSPGPLHRPGQPCLVCHSDRGPASKKPFVIAGTVFETKMADSKAAEKVEIHVRDSLNQSPGVFKTNAAGNFFITAGDFKGDPAFPLKVGIERDGKTKTMTTTINREGSCGFCHKPPAGSPLAVDGDEPRSSIVQIYFEGAQ
jgi:hypothetical protein